MATEYVVRYSHVYCDDGIAEWDDATFDTQLDAMTFMMKRFDECDNVILFERDVVDNDIPF